MCVLLPAKRARRSVNSNHVATSCVKSAHLGKLSQDGAVINCQARNRLQRISSIQRFCLPDALHSCCRKCGKTSIIGSNNNHAINVQRTCKVRDLRANLCLGNKVTCCSINCFESRTTHVIDSVFNNDLIRNKSRCILSSLSNTPAQGCRVNWGALRSSGTVSATKTAPRCIVVRVLSKWIDNQLFLRSWNGAILSTICPGNGSVFVQGNIVCYLVRKLAVHKELPPLIGTIYLRCCKRKSL